MKNKSRTKTILRMAPFPTEEESGRGLHPYELSKLENCKVIYLTFFKKDAMPFEIPENVNLHIGTFYTDPYPRTKGLFTRLIFQIYRLFRVITFSIHGIYLMVKYKVDIIHIHSAMFILVALAGKILKKVNIITFHGADYFRIENAIWYRCFSKCIDTVFSISPRFIKKLTEIHKCLVLQTFNGIKTDVYKNFKLERKKQILTVTNFKKQKGLEFLIEGYSMFIKKYPQYNSYNLVIVGNGLLFEEKSKLIKELNLESKISLLGQKNRSQLIQLYNESEIFILPSIWEGFAKVLVEAMACGCKIISTNVDSAPLVLEDWGYIINPSESNEICESLNKIIKDCNYPFEKQQAVLKKFTWSTVRAAYSDTVFN